VRWSILEPVRLAGTRLPLAIALALLFLVPVMPTACGGGGAENETASRSPQEEEDDARTPDYQGTDDSVDRSGWRWKGKRRQCFFRYRNRCYDKLEVACAAAACSGGSECVHDESAPAVVSCRK
jgi:hypothetical protein